VGLSLFHALLNEKSRLIFQMGASDATYKQTTADVDQTTYRGLVGFDHAFTEMTRMRILGGAHYTESDFPGAGRSFDEDETGFLVDASADWTGERLSLSAGVNRDIAQSIYGENMTRDQVDAGMEFRWTERLRSNLSAAYRRSETEGIIRDEEWTTYTVRPSMNYRITETIRFSMGYAYTWTENEISDDREERNRVFVQLAMGWPVTW
jgi:outer membrane protein assembly factor BamA